VISKSKSVIALCVCLALAQACKHKNDSVSELTLAHDIAPEPPRVGPVTITLRATDASQKPVTGARIALEANMTHPGMAPVFAGVKETVPGTYISAMELSMAGDWLVVAHMTLPDGRKVDQEFEIKGVR
jgi:YtkA-like protein